MYSTKYAIFATFSFPKFSPMFFNILCITIIIKIVPNSVIDETISIANNFIINQF